MLTKHKLAIELVPSTIWHSNLYNYYKNMDKMDKWHELKEFLFQTEGRQCHLCKKESKYLEAHEFFEYDDYKHIQKLTGIHHLCGLCHKIKHIGLWCHTAEGQFKLKKQGLSRDHLVKHFCKVNQCTEKAFLNHENNAFEQWSKRSKHQWKQELGLYNPKFDLKGITSQRKLI